MIEVIFNEKNYCIAYVDWKLIDNYGNLDNHGTYCWVDSFWVHPSISIFSVVEEFTKKVIKRASWIEYVYFQRYEKYGENSWKLYRIETFLRRCIKINNFNIEEIEEYCIKT